MKVFSLLMLFGTAATAAVVEGTVINAFTRAALDGANVQLTHTGATPQKSEYRAKTDSRGAFRIDGVAAGDYVLVLEKAAFLPLANEHVAARPFRVSDVSDVIRLNAELQQMPRLSGRVTDSENRPLAGIGVELGRASGGGVNLTRTDQQGGFVFDGVMPGRYILLARAEANLIGASGLRREKASIDPPRSEAGERAGWAPTYFPGVTDRRAANVIVMRAGADLQNYDLRLRSVPVYALRGTVVDDQGRRAGGAVVKITKADDWALPEGEAKTAEDGSYEFTGVRAGDWRVQASLKKGERDLRGFTIALLSRWDLERVEIRLGPPFTVEGFVDREEPRGADGKRPTSAVYLIPTDGQPEQRGKFHEQDGTFRFENVYPGRYRIRPVGFVRGYYVASVLLGTQEVTTEDVDLREGAPAIRITYKPNPGRVRGTVEKGEGSTVAILPRDESLFDRQFMRSVRCGAGGAFEIDSVRPGEYYAFAFDRVDDDLLEDAAFMQTLYPRAVRVSVGHGEVAAVSLRVTPWPEP